MLLEDKAVCRRVRASNCQMAPRWDRHAIDDTKIQSRRVGDRYDFPLHVERKGHILWTPAIRAGSLPLRSSPSTRAAGRSAVQSVAVIDAVNRLLLVALEVSRIRRVLISGLGFLVWKFGENTGR
jgi:hypothetical protein